MSNSSNVEIIQILGLSIPPFLLLMGNIGCICNYITLTDKQLRRNACGIYFLSSSIVDFFILNFNLLSRWIHDGFLIDPTMTKSLFYCKFRNYFVIVLPIISTSFLILASIDRWALSSSNVNRRKFSNRKLAYLLIIVITIFWLIILSHQLIFYEIFEDRCDGNSKNYDIFHGIFNIFCIGLIPSLLLSIFGYLTLRNVQQSIHRINPQMSLIIQRININRRQTQLIRMVLVQVITTICLLFPYLLSMFYITISKYLYDKNILNEHRRMENLIDLITRDLWYLNFTKSFYIYTLSSTLFRKIFKKRFKILFEFCRSNGLNSISQYTTTQNDHRTNIYSVQFA
jgi:hypothetical protein